MDSSRQRQPSRNAFREPLDRRFDQWIETGRQFVDGVSGTRPGKRRSNNLDRRSSSSLRKVGRWVGDKLDWFLEEEDGWLEPWETGQNDNFSKIKRPLDAISKRVPKSLPISSKSNIRVSDEEEWPDDGSFRVDRWKRSEVQENLDLSSLPNNNNKAKSSQRRPLPRSSRKRD